MVYQGPSKACARCKQRHIKCDETRPSCRNCIKRQLPCPGYAPEPGIRFQDETSSTISSAQQQQQGRRRGSKRPAGKDVSLVPQASPEDTERVALQFFFDNYATLGRGAQSSHGFFEIIMPTYGSAAPSSAMAAATTAVALTLTSEWHGMDNEAPLARRHLGKALSLLRHSLNDPVLSLNDDTMMAVLLLKYHDMLVAYKNLKEVPEDHVNGAIALIKHRGIASFSSDTSKRMLQYVRHTAISGAIQRRTKLDLESDLWKDPASMLKTPCIDLDRIGVEVANLRSSAEVRRLLHYSPGALPLDEKQTRDIRYVREQTAKLEIRLNLWSDGLGGRWRPVNISDTHGIDPSIRARGLYGRTCEVFPSAQIANVWNLYRSYCLLGLELKLRCEALKESDAQKRVIANDVTLYQDRVDELCASIPFLLGNRAEPCTMDEFELKGDIKFLKHPDDGKANVDCLEMDMFMDEEQRAKSLLAQGPWSLYEYFNQIVRFVTSDVGTSLGSIVRPGQTEWIQQQMQRVMTIQRIEGKGKAPELKSRRSNASIRSTTGVSGVGSSTTNTDASKDRRKVEKEESEEGV